jgi:hypothetical protein
MILVGETERMPTRFNSGDQIEGTRSVNAKQRENEEVKRTAEGLAGTWTARTRAGEIIIFNHSGKDAGPFP